MSRVTAFLPALLLIAAGCTGPTEVVGPGDPAKLKGYSQPVSATFGPPETRKLHSLITSRPFRERLRTYTCGDPLPSFDVTLAFWPERRYNERLVFVYTEPSLAPDARGLCLAVGFTYEVDRVLVELDRGPAMKYTYRDPLTGKPKTIEASPVHPRRPVCDCSRRAPDNFDWVDLVD